MKFSIRCGKWTFSPGLVSSFFTLLLIPIFVHLGLWQLQRWDEKINTQKELEARIKEPVLNIEMIKEIEKVDDARYRRLQVSGTFLNDKQILLDNQIFKKRVGYRVITPLLTTEQKILLVDRGWIPLGKSREELPFIVPVTGEVSVVGMINQLAHGLKLNKYPPIQKTSVFPLIIQQIEYKKLASQLNLEVLPFVLQIGPTDPFGFESPSPSFGIPASRHLGYAVQWFGMAIATLVYYLVINCYLFKNVKKVNTQT